MQIIQRPRSFVAAMALVLCCANYLQANSDIYNKTLKSAAWIVCSRTTGSGVVVDKKERLVATNFHVVGHEKEIRVRFPMQRDGQLVAKKSVYQATLEKDGIPAKIVLQDPKRDLAVIQLDSLPDGVEEIQFADKVNPGDPVHSIGNPSASDGLWIYSSGSVRQIYEKEFPLWNGYQVQALIVETQAPLNPGDSGGPVVNAEGKLVALAQSIRKDAQLISACVSSGELKDLLAGNVKAIDPRLAKAMKVTGIKVEPDAYGDYVLRYSNKTEEPVFMLVPSTTTKLNGLELRTISCRFYQSDKPFDADLMGYLLRSNYNFHFGAFSIQERKDPKVYRIVFSVQVLADITPQELYKAVEVVGHTSLNTRRNVRERLADGLKSPQLSGIWKQINAEGKSITLEVKDDGSFALISAASQVRGKISFEKRQLLTTIAGLDEKLADIGDVSADELVLKLRGRELKFARAAAESQPAEQPVKAPAEDLEPAPTAQEPPTE